MFKSKKDEAMEKIRTELLVAENAPFFSYRQANDYFTVVGEGDYNAKILFVGEAPGKTEAETGRPFCGRAGKILANLLASIKLNREDVYITNIVKDRPPNNRDPKPAEIDFYTPFLDRQIDIIKPAVIATLGRFSTKYILSKFDSSEKLETISVLHGRKITVENEIGRFVVVPLFHPAAAIYNQKLKDVLVSDFQILTEFI